MDERSAITEDNKIIKGIKSHLIAMPDDNLILLKLLIERELEERYNKKLKQKKEKL